MDYENLVSICLTTRYGIKIYSSRVIKYYNFYRKLVQDIDISRYYKIGKKEDNFKITNDLFKLSTRQTDIIYFRELYGCDIFNSDNDYDIFEMIDVAYTQKYGYSIENTPAFKTYVELFNKIKNNKIQDGVEDCYKLLEEPEKNGDIINKKLQSLSLAVITKKEIPVVNNNNVNDGGDKKFLVIKKNTFGQFVYEKYNLVLNPSTKCIVGTPNGMGGVHNLDTDGIELCEKLKLKYTSP